MNPLTKLRNTFGAHLKGQPEGPPYFVCLVVMPSPWGPSIEGAKLGFGYPKDVLVRMRDNIEDLLARGTN